MHSTLRKNVSIAIEAQTLHQLSVYHSPQSSSRFFDRTAREDDRLEDSITCSITTAHTPDYFTLDIVIAEAPLGIIYLAPASACYNR